MSRITIKAENVSKRYKIGIAKHRHDTLRDQLADGFNSLFRRDSHRSAMSPGHPAPSDTFWAIKDVSFEVREGEVVGVIGRNGAGKSTLLKILSRITEPDEGRVEIYGRVGSLLEVGTGFHPELTGRENIYLNGGILGMRKAEIQRKFDEIVAFSEIERFIDTPVKRYSSGMYVRLAFAVAAHLEPEVLIVDEVLAVGDLSFQKKCLGKMEGVAQEGRTVLFVSHNMAAVEHLCNRALILDGGKVTFRGPVKEAMDHYIRSFSGVNGVACSHIADLSAAAGRPRKYSPILKRLELLTHEDKPVNGGVKIGAPLKVCVSFRLEKPTARFDLSLGFDNQLGQRVFTASSNFQRERPDEERVGDQIFVCALPSLPLVPGEYKIKVLLDIDGGDADRVDDAARVMILESDYYGTGKSAWNGFFVLKQHWYSQ